MILRKEWYTVCIYWWHNTFFFFLSLSLSLHFALSVVSCWPLVRQSPLHGIKYFFKWKKFINGKKLPKWIQHCVDRFAFSRARHRKSKTKQKQGRDRGKKYIKRSKCVWAVKSHYSLKIAAADANIVVVSLSFISTLLFFFGYINRKHFVSSALRTYFLSLAHPVCIYSLLKLIIITVYIHFFTRIKDVDT